MQDKHILISSVIFHLTWIGIAEFKSRQLKLPIAFAVLSHEDSISSWDNFFSEASWQNYKPAHFFYFLPSCFSVLLR